MIVGDINSMITRNLTILYVQHPLFSDCNFRHDLIKYRFSFDFQKINEAD